MINLLLMEFIGAFIFLLVMLIITSDEIDRSSYMIIIITIFMFIIIFCAQFKGGHFNPAVSFTKTIQGKIPVSTCLAYITTQLVAALCAVYVYKIIYKKYIKK